jgi:hypothetical protein
MGLADQGTTSLWVLVSTAVVLLNALVGLGVEK